MGKIFYLPQREGIRILGMYSKNKGVYFATPDNCKHMAHATWLNPGASKYSHCSNIDYFLVDGRVDNRLIEKYRKDNAPVVVHDKGIPNEMKDVERVYSTQLKVAEEFRYFREAIVEVMNRDIYYHTLGRALPKVFREGSEIYVNRLDSEAKISALREAKLDVDGKQTFYPECILDLNLDFAGWCVAGIDKEGKLAPWNSCSYCYAAYKHSGYPNIFSADRKNLASQIKEARAQRAEEGLFTRFLRLGKRTEVGADIFRSQLVETLGACFDEHIPAVFPTKHLSFNEEIAEMLKKTNSTLLYSIGHDTLEKGAVIRGCTNEWRFEQAKKYLEKGVRVAPYVLVDPAEENGGKLFSGNLAKAKEFPQVQVIPVRSRYVDLGAKVLGRGFRECVGEQGVNLFGEQVGGYEVSPDRTRLGVDIHSSISSLVADNTGNIGMCHHNSFCTWCRKCFVPGEKGVIVSTKEVRVEKKVKAFGKRRERYSKGEVLFDMGSFKKVL